MARADRTLAAVPASSVAKSKRKSVPREDEDDDSGSGSESGSDVSVINVDFDFFNLNPEVDLIALKRLLRQTLSHDEELIDVHPLAELILSDGTRIGAGSTIKTDGEESDPWAVLMALDIGRNRTNPAFETFSRYLLSTLPPSSPIRHSLDGSSTSTSSNPALVFSLRMLNLPLPLIPPSYRMLLSELQNSSEPPNFTHYIIWGRGYRLEGTEDSMGLAMEPTTGGKKKRKAKGTGNGQIPLAQGSFSYHAEEEFFDKNAESVQTYSFKSAPKRDEDAFGVEQFGRLVLLTKDQMELAVKEMEAAAQ